MSFHKVWTRPSLLDAGGSVGRKARARQRAGEAAASLARLQRIVKREAPDFASGQPPLDGQATVDRLVKCVRDEATSPSDWRNQLGFLANAVDRGNREKLWALIAPNTFINLKRDKLLRDEAFFRRGTAFVAIRQGFVAELARLHLHEERWNRAGASAAAMRRGELVLASALLFGGLCNGKILDLLPHALRTLRIQRCGEQIWLDLRVPESMADQLNLVDEDEALHRWCPDELTAALFVYFLRHHSVDQFPTVAQGSASQRAQHVIASISGLLTDIGISIPTGMTAKQWCQGAWAAIERQPGGSLPAYLAEYALGRIPSCSLPTDRWVALLNQRVSDADLSGAPPDSPPSALSVSFPAIQTGALDPDTNRVARRLLQALRPHSSKKAAKADCIRNLEALVESRLLGQHVVAQLLVHWATLLLSHGSSAHRRALAPSTVYGSYMAPIAQALIGLVFSEGVDDIRDLEAEDFEVLYEDVLQTSRWKEKAIPAAAVQEFHHYLETQYGCPSLETPIPRTSRRTPRVRALIVTEAEYQAARRSLLVQKSSNPDRWELLEMALFLGFRAGLRPGEALKLRLVDVFVGPEDTVITVRTNRYGTNKNRPSLRRIDLAALCPADEYAWFARQVALRQAQFEQNPGALLLSEAPRRDLRCDQDFLRAHLQPILRTCSGNPHILYYSLRHSALTRIHLRSEIPERDHEIHELHEHVPVDYGLVPALTGGSRSSMKRLYAVAAVAGHASPEMTLTSYLHGLDLILYEKVRATLPFLDAEVYAHLLGRRYQSVARYLKDWRQPDPAPASTFRPWIMKALPTETHPAPGTGAFVIPEVDIEATEVQPALPDIERMLIDHDNGYPLPTIAKRSGVNEQQCESIVDAARRVASIHSNKGRPRLITQRRRVRHSGAGEPLAPSYPASEPDVQLAARMIGRLRPLLPATGALGDIVPAIEYFLNHVEANNSGVRFYQPGEATLFVSLLAEIADHRRMIFGTHVHSVRSRLDASRQRASWQKRLDIRVRNDDTSPPLKRDGGRFGKLTVSLALPNGPGRLNSAHAYKYVLHLAAIALVASGRIQIPVPHGYPTA